MRHRVKSQRLNRNQSELNAMLRNMATSLVLYEKIKTTRAKGKMLKPIVEKMITVAKKDTPMTAMRKFNAYFLDDNASKKLARDLSEKYKDRNSGFVRITNLGFRAGDAAPMVLLELI